MIDLRNVFDRLDSMAKQDILQQEEFQLSPPEEWDDDEDSLGDQSTNDDISIELKEETKDGMRILRSSKI
jgi:hypothetical protein